MGASALLASYGSPLRVCDSAKFDGSTNTLTKAGNFTGIADSGKGILSFWYRPDSFATDHDFLDTNPPAPGGTPGLSIWMAGASHNAPQVVVGANSAGTTVLNVTNPGAPFVAGVWHHLLCAWDLTIPTAKWFRDGVQLTTVNTATLNGIIDLTPATGWVIGGVNTPTLTPDLNGCLAEYYFAPGQFLDFTLVANLRKFYSASGKPVHLGSDGSLPLGVKPAIYLHLDDGEAVANFAINRSGNGNFTVGGTLATGSTSPSD